MKRPDDWTILKLIQWTTTYFKQQGIESARIDAELLLAFALDVQRIDLYLRYDQPLNPNELARFRGLVKRRAAREPVAYITGAKEFWDLTLAVGPAVLIPRPETECLVEAVLDFMKGYTGSGEPLILDLGTGSGAIALALAQSCPTARVAAVERSAEALATADRNRRRCGLADRVHLVSGDWLAPIKAYPALCDVIVSNPPYIPSGDIDGLQPEIVRYEPRAALDGGPAGLDCLDRIIATAPACLRPGGGLFLEIGHDQFPVVQRLAENRGAYREAVCRQDYGGHDRVACLVRC